MRLYQKILSGILASLLALAQSPCAWGRSRAAKVDVSTAKKHYDSGQNKFRDGDFAGALEDFQIANDIKATPQAERYVGRCLDQLGRLRAATEWYDKFLSHVPAKMAVHGERIRRRDAEIKAMPGRLHIETNPQGASINVDGSPQSAPTPTDVELAPGVHRIKIVGRGRSTAERSVDVAFASTQALSVDLETEPPPGSSRETRVAAVRPAAAELAPTEQSRPSAEGRLASAEERAADEDPAAADGAPAGDAAQSPKGPRIPLRAYLTGGAAVVAAGVGTAFGVAALNDKKEFERNPTTQNADTRSQHALIADIALGVAVASGVATAVLLLKSDRPPAPRDASTKRTSIEAGGVERTKAVTIIPAPMIGPHGGGAGLILQF